MIKWICLDCEHEWKNLTLNRPLYCVNCWMDNVRKKQPTLGDLLADFQSKTLAEDFADKLKARHSLLTDQQAESLAIVCIECGVTVDEVLYLFTSSSSSAAEAIRKITGGAN